MKISDATVAILKNFSSINQSLLFPEGNVILTISLQRNILAKATVSEDFPQEFAIYDLNQFLGALGLFNDPDLEFHDSSLWIRETKSRLKYTYADKTVIPKLPEKELKFPDPEIRFEMSREQLAKVVKAASVLSLPEIHVVGDKENVYLVADNAASNAADSFLEEVGKSSDKFSMVFKIENLKLLPGDYEVAISSKGISHFVSKGLDLEYWIATESTSTFGDTADTTTSDEEY